MGNYDKDLIVYLSLFTVVFFILISSTVFSWRNPKANDLQYWKHFGKAITFQKIEKFQ